MDSLRALHVELGSVNREPEARIQANLQFTHPNYNFVTLTNNLALVRLVMNVTTTVNIQTIRLPSRAQENIAFDNFTATVTGHGQTVLNGKFQYKEMSLENPYIFFPIFQEYLLHNYCLPQLELFPIYSVPNSIMQPLSRQVLCVLWAIPLTHKVLV